METFGVLSANSQETREPGEINNLTIHIKPDFKIQEKQIVRLRTCRQKEQDQRVLLKNLLS